MMFKGNVSNLRAWAVLMHSDGSHRVLNAVVHGDIELSINTTTRHVKNNYQNFQLFPNVA